MYFKNMALETLNFWTILHVQYTSYPKNLDFSQISLTFSFKVKDFFKNLFLIIKKITNKEELGSAVYFFAFRTKISNLS